MLTASAYARPGKVRLRSRTLVNMVNNRGPNEEHPKVLRTYQTDIHSKADCTSDQTVKILTPVYYKLRKFVSGTGCYETVKLPKSALGLLS